MLTLVIIEKLVHLVSNNWCLELKFQGQLLFFIFKLWRHNTLSSSLDNRDLIQNIHDPFFKSPAGLRPSLRYTVTEEEYGTISVLCRTTQWWVCSSSSFLLAWSRYTGTKWPLSTEKASLVSKTHSTSLPSTPWSSWTGVLSQVSKNDDEKTMLLRVIWL